MSPHFHWPHLHWPQSAEWRRGVGALSAVAGVVALSVLASAAQVIGAAEPQAREQFQARAGDLPPAATGEAQAVPVMLIELPPASVEAMSL